MEVGSSSPRLTYQAGEGGPSPLQIPPEDRTDGVVRIIWRLYRQPVRQHEADAVHSNLLDLAAPLLFSHDAPGAPPDS